VWRRNAALPGFKYNMSTSPRRSACINSRSCRRSTSAAASSRRATPRARRLPEIETPVERTGFGHAWHLYVVRIAIERLRVDATDRGGTRRAEHRRQRPLPAVPCTRTTATATPRAGRVPRHDGRVARACLASAASVDDPTPTATTPWSPRRRDPRPPPMKRAFDLLASLVLLRTPLIAARGAGALREARSGGPAIFHAVRVGREGRTFRLHKLRTADRRSRRPGAHHRKPIRAFTPLGPLPAPHAPRRTPPALERARRRDGASSALGPRPAVRRCERRDWATRARPSVPASPDRRSSRCGRRATTPRRGRPERDYANACCPRSSARISRTSTDARSAATWPCSRARAPRARGAPVSDELVVPGARLVFDAAGGVTAAQRIPLERPVLRVTFPGAPRAAWKHDAPDAPAPRRRRRRSPRRRGAHPARGAADCGSRGGGVRPDSAEAKHGRRLLLDEHGGLRRLPDAPAAARGVRFRLRTRARRRAVDLGLPAASAVAAAVRRARRPRGRPRPFPDGAYPSTEIIEDAARHCRVFALHAYFWSRARAASISPPDATRCAAVRGRPRVTSPPIRSGSSA